MIYQRSQSGLSLNGFIIFLLVFILIAFGAGWLANKYYSNRLFLTQSPTLDFPSAINVDAKPDGLTWDGQNLIFSNRASPWGLVRITPLENGQYRKASIPVVDTESKQQHNFQGLTWNGTAFVAVTSRDGFQSGFTKVFVELDSLTLQITKVLGKAPDFAHCIAWDGQNYWAGTRFHTTEKAGKPALYKFDQNLKLIDEYAGAGIGCQGMAWDGKFLWWGDVFSNSVTLYNIYNSKNVPPAIVHQYTTSIDHLSGIAFDGKNIWLGDYQDLQLKQLQNDLYFDWLGGRYEVSNPGQLEMLDQFARYRTGNVQINELLKPLLEGKVKAAGIPAYVAALRPRYSDDEIRQILNSARDRVSQDSITSALDHELGKLVNSGEIDYVNDDPVEPDSVKIQYFTAVIENGDLVADWKVIPGSEILSGIDAPRPQQIPDDYDFYTFIQYTVRIIDLDTGEEEEQEYDFFGSEDLQTGVVLLQNIQPGEYQIEIDLDAQYYTESAASHYSGKLEINVSY
uniref:Secreted protein n=1 Tax=uncultured bacterium ws633F6 TaxID=1131832 RepID=I1X500_9BACT|nr:secreted protein [uncultured bacterium ws633F6]